MDDEFGIVTGHVETVHAYTNDQNLIDNYHKANRRGRSAPLNMVITETGAATAVGKVLPQMAGKLTGNAIRVPTPNVSMAILNLTLDRDTTAEEVNEYMRKWRCTRPCASRSTSPIRRRSYPRISSAPGTPVVRCRGHDRQRHALRFCTSGTTTSSATAARCSASCKRWPASSITLIYPKVETIGLSRRQRFQGPANRGRSPPRHCDQLPRIPLGKN